MDMYTFWTWEHIHRHSSVLTFTRNGYLPFVLYLGLVKNYISSEQLSHCHLFTLTRQKKQTPHL